MLFTRRSYNSLFLVLCVFISFTLLLLHLEQVDARLNLVVVDDGAVVVESDLHPKGSGSFIDFPTSGRSNKLYVPSAASSNALPLLVMLHGCTQNPDDFATGTRMNDHGEQRGFFVLYPEEPSWANEDECWNWFLPEDQARGGGEPQVIADMVAKVESKYNIDKKRVYVAGLSAGAAMAVIVGVVYPDIFAAVGVCSGLEFEAATSAIEAWTAMVIGGPDPSGQGQVAYQAEGGNARVQGVLVAHGTADITVFPVNGQQVVAQYTTTLDYVLGNGTSNGYITDTPTNTTNGQVPGGHSYTLNEYADSQTGTVLVKYIEVDGMPHAWSGGSSSGTFTDPEGPDVSSILVDWFFSSFPYNATRTFAKEW